MKYVITIVDLTNGTTGNYTRTSKEELEVLLNRQVGGWDNLIMACTTGNNTHEDESFAAGVTKDNIHAISILSINID